MKQKPTSRKTTSSKSASKKKTSRHFSAKARGSKRVKKCCASSEKKKTSRHFSAKATKRSLLRLRASEGHAKRVVKKADRTPFDLLAFLVAVAVFMVLLPTGSQGPIDSMGGESFHGAATIEEPCGAKRKEVERALQDLKISERFLNRASNRYERYCEVELNDAECKRYEILFQNAVDERIYRIQVLEWAEGDYEECMR